MTYPPEKLSALRTLLERAAPGPWELCQHLKGVKEDAACKCGYRGVVFGPERVGYAVLQPGHEPAPAGQEGSEPPRYPREIEIANMQLIVAAINALPSLLDAIERRESPISPSGDLKLREGMDRDTLCRMIEKGCPVWDQGHPVATEVEALADSILATLPEARGDAPVSEAQGGEELHG